MAVSANRLELLQIADAVAREKAIDRGIVIAAMEDAIQKAARSRYGSETEVRAEINPKTGEMRLSRLLLVVDQLENDAIHISIEDARRRNPAARVGDQATCVGPPDVIVKGSGTVLIGGPPAARMGDSTGHGGVIVLGCPTVLIGG